MDLAVVIVAVIVASVVGADDVAVLVLPVAVI